VTMNKYKPHAYVIPEDDADRQLADGFVLHHQVKDNQIQVVPPAGGWFKVLTTFRDEYVPRLRAYQDAHVIMLIDFDDQVEKRRAQFEQEVPEELRTRVFVVGSKHNPETLSKAFKIRFEEIGKSLANDCAIGTAQYWDHEQLQHNDSERLRLVQTVRPFLF
jgi:hypothetical protein